MRVSVAVESQVKITPRVTQLLGLFDIPPSPISGQVWDFDIPLEERDWNIGLIVGPSGAGKTTVAKSIWGDQVISGFEWDPEEAIIDGFPTQIGIKQVTGLLTSVGFSSPPFWLRPFRVLSTGQQFRVTLARAIASYDCPVIDEFTSVVDRTVAQVGSAAVAKAVRRAGKRFVGVTCHYDVEDWLQPDWILEPHLKKFQWRCLQQRPGIELEIYRVERSSWRLFESHHYMSARLHRGSECFIATYKDNPVAFTSYLHFPHPRVDDIKMGHRLVVLPDYQGLGIGGALDDWLGEYLHEKGYRYRNTVAHPAMVAYYSHSPRWKLTQEQYRLSCGNTTKALKKKQMSARRLGLRGFEYVPLPQK